MGTIVSLIRELASYERIEHEMEATEDDVRDALFGEWPSAEAVLAYAGGELAGYALFFHNFSTFVGRRGLYLEDLFVRPEGRGRGHGKALLAALPRVAVERGWGRMEWSVLNWNQPAIDVYRSIGAVPLDEWTTYRLTGEALERLAVKVRGSSFEAPPTTTRY